MNHLPFPQHLLGKAEYLIHLACSSLPQNSNLDPHFDITSNLIGSLRLLDAARLSKIKRVIFLSSGGTVYGIPESIPITELHPTNPACSYGITKLAFEKYIHLYHSLYNLDGLILRVANPYGERQRTEHSQGVIPNFCHNLLQPLGFGRWINHTRLHLYF